MNVALLNEDMFEAFEPKIDTLFFKVGMKGMVSFHGRNYNMRKRMTAEERNHLIADALFVRATDNCYVNVNKVTSVSNDCLYFENITDHAKQVPLSWRNQSIIKQRLLERGIVVS